MYLKSAKSILIEKLSIGIVVLMLPEVISQKEIEENLNIISKNVKNIRVANNMSQLEVALSLGQRSTGFYANAENCKSEKRFNLIHLMKLAKVFDVPLIAFFEGIDK